MLRRPSSSPGRHGNSTRWTYEETAPGRSIQNDQPTMEGTLTRGASLLGGVGKGEEEGARADVSQLRLSTPEDQGPEGEEGEAWRRRRFGKQHFVRPSPVCTCGRQESRPFVLGSYPAALPDHPDSVGLHAFMPYVTINGPDDQPESIPSGSRIKFVFPIRFRGFEYCYAPAAIFPVRDVPRCQCKSLEWL